MYNIREDKNTYKNLCNKVRKLITDRKFVLCNDLLAEEMKKSPHAPEPHNLFGMLLENEGNHILAMKHFRAAWALDMTYLPAKYNLEIFGTFCSKSQGAYDEDDCKIPAESGNYTVEYDDNKVGHIIRRDKYENK